MKKCLAVVVMMMCAPLVRGATEGVTFAERYALAEDRVAVLAELIPGTDDFFFYHALHAQNTANTQEIGLLIGAASAKLGLCNGYDFW